MPLNIPTARVFHPLLKPSRYKGVHGGRGSGKSHFFAGLLVETAVLKPGLRAVCIREVQKSLKESAKRLIEDKIEEHGLGSLFQIKETEIRTPGDGLIIFQGMQDHTAESIKSLEGFRVAWVEEAQALSQRSLTLLRPTIRASGSELWFSWNPRRKNDPVEFLRGEHHPDGAIVVEANWYDNPWFPKELEQERQNDLINRPELYDHIWEGGYERVTEGAYYARDLIRAKQQGRIGRVAADPLLPTHLFFDIGGAGAKADAASIWAWQFIGREIRVLNYYEAQGQPLAAHVSWMRANDYTPERAVCVLPHDGSTKDRVFDVSYESALISAGYDVEVIPNQGRGAAKMRIEATRRIFDQFWFNEQPTEPGREALGAYHERIDTDRQIGLGPEHDWASHAADSFGLGSVYYEGRRPGPTPAAIDRYREWSEPESEGSWMSA